MIKQNPVDELSQRISALLPDGVRGLQSDIETNIHTLLQETFTKLNLVSREEFDIQCALLQRTREKLDKLEAQVESMQAAAAETEKSD